MCRPRDPSPLDEAQRDLAAAYAPMARAMARRFGHGWPGRADDYEGVALLALTEAAGRFDPARGVKFGTYARHRIRGALIDAQVAERKATARDGRRVGLDEAAGLAARARPDEAEAFEARVAPLGPRCRRVLLAIYFEGRTQGEAAAALGLARTRVCRLHATALAELRAAATP